MEPHRRLEKIQAYIRKLPSFPATENIWPGVLQVNNTSPELNFDDLDDIAEEVNRDIEKAQIFLKIA